MPKSATAYVDQVMAVLISEFPDLADPMITRIVTDRVRAHVQAPSRQLEVILDRPHTANWRLRAGLHDVATVRVSRCSLLSPNAPSEREDRVNARLAALDTACAVPPHSRPTPGPSDPTARTRP